MQCFCGTHAERKYHLWYLIATFEIDWYLFKFDPIFYYYLILKSNQANSNKIYYLVPHLLMKESDLSLIYAIINYLQQGACISFKLIIS